MTDSARTPSSNAVDNIKQWMRTKHVSQQDLTDRLTRLERADGDEIDNTRTWHRRSINRLLNGERRIDIDEMYAIAVALDVTVSMILFPTAPSESDHHLYQIGGLPVVGDWEMEALLAKPAEVMSRSRIGVEGWETDEPLMWVRKPSAVAEAAEQLRGAYEEAHPGIDIDTARGGEILRWARNQRAEPDR